MQLQDPSVMCASRRDGPAQPRARPFHPRTDLDVVTARRVFCWLLMPKKALLVRYEEVA
jgi:hypothetical protein